MVLVHLRMSNLIIIICGDLLKDAKIRSYRNIDRSWYGRVLVERVEGFASQNEWQRASDEINQFEKMWTDEGTIILKFFLSLDKDEQLKRFKDRENNPDKQWKITEEDWRNREKWDEYLEASQDMIESTNTSYAPWYIVPADHKNGSD